MQSNLKKSINSPSSQSNMQFTYYQQFQNHPLKKAPSISIKKQPPISALLSKHIQQVPQEDLTSIMGSRQFKQQNKKKRAISSQQNGIIQFNMNDKKIKKKRMSQVNQKKLQEEVDGLLKQSVQQKYKKQTEKYDQNKDRQNFAEKYKQQLRRTVFHQKLIIKSKKDKQIKNFQTLDSVRLEQNQYQNQQKYIKPTLQSYVVRKNSINIDSMYKTIIHKQRTRQLSFQQLDVSKFPIIIKTKRQQTINYSNLLNVLSTRQRNMKLQHKNVKFNKFVKNKEQRSVSRGSNFQKHQIKPWDTFTDQFVQ